MSILVISLSLLVTFPLVTGEMTAGGLRRILQDEKGEKDLARRDTPADILRKSLDSAVLEPNGCRCEKDGSLFRDSYNFTSLGRTLASGPGCDCCFRLRAPVLKLDEPVCVNITYLPEQIGLSFTLTMGGIVLINQTISVTNPPPFCITIPVPGLEKLMSVCVDFYDLGFKDRNLHGCVRFSLRLVYIISKDLELGCFNIPIKDASESRGFTLLWCLSHRTVVDIGYGTPYAMNTTKWTRDIMKIRDRRLVNGFYASKESQHDAGNTRL